MEADAPRWAALVPELACADFARSRAFYVDLLGFRVRFERPEEAFAYLEREGAQLMLDGSGAGWQTGPLDPPRGRGVNLQIEVADAAALVARLAAAGWPLFEPPRERWYREGRVEHGQAEVLVQDPDGYLLRFAEVLGERPA